MRLDADIKENIRMLEGSVESFQKGIKGVAHARQNRFTEQGFNRHIFETLGELGWIGMLATEENSGSGLGMQETVRLVSELCRILSPEPLISAMVSATLLEGEFARDVISGKTLCVLAWQEESNVLARSNQLRTKYSDGKLSGLKCFIPHGAAADQFLVTTDNGLAMVNPSDGGVNITSCRAQDGGSFASVEFESAGATLVPSRTQGDIDLAMERATLATAAYLLGVAVEAFALTLSYVSMRKQFDVAIGSFQAVQHRMADLKIQLMLTEASINGAARLVDSAASLSEKQGAVSRAKARSADTALLVTRQAVQLHGAIGYTDECDIGLYLRKAMTWMNLFGSAALHRERFAALCA